jgi:hypothetical protein
MTGAEGDLTVKNQNAGSGQFAFFNRGMGVVRCLADCPPKLRVHYRTTEVAKARNCGEISKLEV